MIIPLGAASGYDLQQMGGGQLSPGSAGYFKVARQQADSRSLEVPGRLSPVDSRPGFAAHRHPSAGFDRRPVRLDGGDGTAIRAWPAFCSTTCPTAVDEGFRVFGGQ